MDEKTARIDCLIREREREASTRCARSHQAAPETSRALQQCTPQRPSPFYPKGFEELVGGVRHNPVPIPQRCPESRAVHDMEPRLGHESEKFRESRLEHRSVAHVPPGTVIDEDFHGGR